MIGVGRNRRLVRSGGSVFGSWLDRRLVRDEIGVWIGVWLGADRRLVCSLIGIWFAR